MAQDPRTSLLVRAAELYFERGLSQQEVAEILDTSRPTVSRLLAEARARGIVQITIQRPIEKVPQISEELRRAFHLRDAVVVAGGQTDEHSLQRVGEAAAELLLSLLRDDLIIGITWGRTLYHTVRALGDVDLSGIEIIQIMGGMGRGDPRIDGPELALRLAERLHGTYRYIHAPAVVESESLAALLLQQAQVRETLEAASRFDILLGSIGGLLNDTSSLQRAGYLTEEERQAALAQGGVGHLLARIIDIFGNEVSDYNRRVVALPLSRLRDATWSIGIAASPGKAPGMLGAMRARYFNTVVLDDETASEILRLDQDGRHRDLPVK